MASSSPKYQYVRTAQGQKLIPIVDDPPMPGPPRDEEPPADYNSGGYLPVKVADSFKDGRYTVIRKLGWGHFSTVWLVKDAQQKRHSALKVVKSAGRYTETARDEIKLLRQIAETSPSHPGRAHIVSFLDSFSHSSISNTHICIIFEPLGENLLSLIEKNRRKGVAPCIVKSIARQVLLGLQYLHEECDLVHTDIKPENIMMSIPDIESHIVAQLSTSVPPQAHKLPIPPNPRTRRISSIATHALTSQNRSVHIFESQPLPSPSGHHIHTRLFGPSSNNSSSSTISSLVDSHSSVGTAATTPATSLGSAMSKLKLSSPESPSQALPDQNTHVSGKVSAAAVPSGPSLLSQTAPHRRSTSRSSKRLSTSPASSSSTSGSDCSLPESMATSVSSDVPSSFLPISIKIADMGNATPSKRHYTEDIQTRQYRSPEAIIGRSDWGCKVDIWSVACVIFELLTAEYLFEPQAQGQIFSKDDDHMAQIIELLGDLPPEAKQGGRYSRELFDHTGALRYIRHLKPWPLNRVMREKYLLPAADAEALCSFLEPMLALDMHQRASAGEMISHPWLDVDWKEEGEALQSVVW
ncbi:kinase-like protein [Artomyces pyxidatus]|uniref:Kinase-like protein n=1 Tax=Artomyces pyxidatus TaxID=48021 RepID=A0ACB8THQ9_9AGAM|nr:kinase-like protein [Artomyces pyxidatus]